LHVRTPDILTSSDSSFPSQQSRNRQPNIPELNSAACSTSTWSPQLCATDESL
jgi:hypothetical protein